MLLAQLQNKPADAKQINEEREAAEEAVEDVAEETAEEAVEAEAEDTVET